MSRFQRILVAVDGSEAAWHALDAAVELAVALGAEVRVLGVEGPLPRYAATAGEVDEMVSERESFFAGVLAEARAVAIARGLEITTAVVSGHPPEAIVRHAKETAIDLIAMGHRGHFLQQFPLGSTAARVTRHAHCPCSWCADAGRCRSSSFTMPG